VTQVSSRPGHDPKHLDPPGPGVPPETTEINRDFSGLLTSPVDYLKSGSFNLAFQGLTKQLKILLSFAPRTKVTQSPLLLLSHKIAISLWTLPLWLQNDKSQQPTSDTKPQVAFRDQGEVSLHRICSLPHDQTLLSYNIKIRPLSAGSHLTSTGVGNGHRGRLTSSTNSNSDCGKQALRQS
jgi:hypothetical protein